MEFGTTPIHTDAGCIIVVFCCSLHSGKSYSIASTLKFSKYFYNNFNLFLVFQLIMYVLRLGIISSLLSETLVSGFTTGAAIHVFTSQVKDLLGIKLTPVIGNYKIILVHYFDEKKIQLR